MQTAFETSSLNRGKLALVSHALCPYVQRAVIALQEKGIAYERIDIDLNAKPEWFLAISPLGKTPVLVANGEAIFESAVICEYLDEVYGPPLHPADPLLRARHRAWIEFASTTLNTIWNFYTATEDADWNAAQQALMERFDRIEQALGSGPYFAGDHFGLVDAAFAPVFRYFDLFDKVCPVDLFAAVPKVSAWRAMLSARPSVMAAVASDYPERLRRFVVARGGVLGRRLANGDAAADGDQKAA